MNKINVMIFLSGDVGALLSGVLLIACTVTALLILVLYLIFRKEIKWYW